MTIKSSKKNSQIHIITNIATTMCDYNGKNKNSDHLSLPSLVMVFEKRMKIYVLDIDEYKLQVVRKDSKYSKHLIMSIMIIIHCKFYQTKLKLLKMKLISWQIVFFQLVFAL